MSTNLEQANDVVGGHHLAVTIVQHFECQTVLVGAQGSAAVVKQDDIVITVAGIADRGLNAVVRDHAGKDEILNAYIRQDLVEVCPIEDPGAAFRND